MNDDIKEILDSINDKYKDYYVQDIVSGDDLKLLLDYITNLQEQLHQASLDIQELIERDIECPSWCDKLTNLQQENEELKKNQRYYKNGVFSLEYDKETMSDMIDDYKSRCEKAVEYINGTTFFGLKSGKTFMSKYLNELLDILNGKE